MRILVIGASGFIGNACFKYFSKIHETLGFDCTGTSSSNLIVNSDFTALPLLIGQEFDAILNCVGSSNIQESFSDPGKDFWLNVVFVQNILEQLKITSPDAKFINISSAAVYGNPEFLPITENSPTIPLSPYGLHKLLSEQIMEEYARLFNLKTLSVRVFSAYGPGLKRQFFHDLYSKFKLKPSVVTLSGTGNESRDFIFISDIVDALDLLIRKGTFTGEVYNLASEQESFIRPSAEMFAGICDFKGKITFSQKQFDGYPLNWKADISKLRDLGFSPKINFGDGLKLYFSWINNN